MKHLPISQAKRSNKFIAKKQACALKTQASALTSDNLRVNNLN